MISPFKNVQISHLQMKNMPRLACRKKSRLFEKTNQKSYMNHIQLHTVYGVKCVKLTCEHFSVTGG